MKKVVIGVCLLFLWTACGGSGSKGVRLEEEDLTAKDMLQGIWLSDDTEMPLMRIEGDTIYYADPQNLPVAFRIIHDTIYVFGCEPIAYKIDRQTEYSFWFHSVASDIIKLHKSEDVEDSLSFADRQVEVIPVIREVMKKDSVVVYNGTRYRGYVYINPSTMKVTRTTYSESGYAVDNVYYDNVIHICVYEGKTLLYGQDITKDLFSDVFPMQFLGHAILADMDFMGVDSKGFHYRAVLGVPESSVSNLADLFISFDKQLVVKAVE